MGFKSALSLSLPFPSLVVASSDDPYCALEHAKLVAREWGSHFVQVGAKGHINVKSNVGEWAEGRKLLDDFVASL